ncbi:leguminosin proline-rich group669 secreted peptide [Medicago truncatula]|uniref:Leguminosin proline-rich group669 secreted peptide n=1 Tax=Medicago truncatula TaxID=3880 RepID=A0A072TRD3_MEDTR|nr:leguminosin proline-rich group669 secreted peptide [Medicago truncatula]
MTTELGLLLVLHISPTSVRSWPDNLFISGGNPHLTSRFPLSGHPSFVFTLQMCNPELVINYYFVLFALTFAFCLCNASNVSLVTIFIRNNLQDEMKITCYSGGSGIYYRRPHTLLQILLFI